MGVEHLLGRRADLGELLDTTLLFELSVRYCRGLQSFYELAHVDAGAVRLGDVFEAGVAGTNHPDSGPVASHALD